MQSILDPLMDLVGQSLPYHANSVLEVKTIITKLKRRKAPGYEGITSEMILAENEVTPDHLQDYFVECGVKKQGLMNESKESYDKSEDIEDYVGRFDQFCLANDITEDDKKRAVFLSTVSAPKNGLLKTLLAPNKPSSRTYRELTELLKNNLNPKPILMPERFKFYNRKQRPGESIIDYATEQRKLVETCQFGAFQEEVLRDLFVIGLANRSARRKLSSELQLDLKKAFSIALSQEMADENVTNIQGETQEVKKVVGLKVSLLECYRCRKTNHKAAVCFHMDTKCNGCHKKGHLRIMCRMENHTTVNRNWKYGRQGRKRSTVNMAEEVTSGSEEETTECKLQDELVHTLKYCAKKIKARHNKVPEIIVKVKLNGIPIDMELDTGASLSMITEEFYTKHL
ncbi:uncharacterized protein [Palaemon carinicauda]|uniref:uncharacterized protein n=1 Tax=Palaemon carinicauda TaxID=392227 RepID=UPI0035B5EB1D